MKPSLKTARVQSQSKKAIENILNKRGSIYSRVSTSTRFSLESTERAATTTQKGKQKST